MKENNTYHTLPFYTMWDIWKCRNASIFENKSLDIYGTCIKNCAYFNEIGPVGKTVHMRNI